MFLLAPLQGYTEVEFRRAWSTVFTGIDHAVSPFISLAEGIRFRDRHLRDVLPRENKRMAVIPQVLGTDPGKFLNLAIRLRELGYETINWNLGCPKRTVARKKRGSGMLPFPGLIRDTLEQLMPGLPLKLSIKTRLGYQTPDDFYELVSVFNDFPLDSLIIHPRTGIQQYDGEMYLDILDETIHEIRHKVIFSGDIKDRRSFAELERRYPTIDDWMIGRGILSSPVLPELLSGTEGADDAGVLRSRQIYFYQELYCEVRARMERTKPILNKMKDYWSYFSLWFDDAENIFVRLARMHSLDDFMEHTKKILNEQPLSPLDGRTNRQIKAGSSK